MLQKIRGRRRGTPPPPIRPGPVGGHGEGRGRVVACGDGLLHPSPGFAPPTGATIAGGTPRTCVFRARYSSGRDDSTASERNREEPRVLARLDAQAKSSACRLTAASAKALRTSSGLVDALAGDIEDHVPGAEALRGGGTIGLDLRDHDAFAASARDLAGRSEREAEPRHFRARRCPRAHSDLARAWRCSRGSSPSVTLTFFSAPLLMTPSLTLAPGGRLEIFLARSRASFTA